MDTTEINLIKEIEQNSPLSLNLINIL